MVFSESVAMDSTSVAEYIDTDFSAVVALQYYNACLVLIRQHKPPDRTLHGFEAVKERRSNEVRPIVSPIKLRC